MEVTQHVTEWVMAILAGDKPGSLLALPRSSESLMKNGLGRQCVAGKEDLAPSNNCHRYERQGVFK